MAYTFNGKVALVTGGASGIGKAVVLELIAQGASVVAVDMVEERLTQLAAELQSQSDKLATCLGNVTSEADVDRMVETATSRFGRLDILVNNAGIMDAMTPVGELSTELWNRVLAVNLTGPFLLSRKAIPIMVAQGEGRIVNVASEAGLRGSAAGAAYTASKHGVIGLTKNTAFMYGPQGIRCNAVCPGGVETNIGIGGDYNPTALGISRVMGVLQATAGSRIAKPVELAAVITFLASDEASFVNGAILAADNGWSAV
ncbi:MAG: SDR family NAD(P)-dependent oxidoreductase [Chloroflexi bacterium]|nr:SDR family NAD(P)-dependent oxidoreductase [Chloroflexota bacterium]OJW04103.1 MAG: 3-ketoacyl-ACP reductase [Chloroflexi bacterium 54-19]